MPTISPKRILVLRGGAIGDFILTLPVLQVLRKNLPRAWIELIAHPAAGRLALAGALADALRPVTGAACAALFSPAPLDREWLDYLGGFELVIDYLHDPAGNVARHLDKNCPGSVVHHTPLVTRGHAIDHFLAPLAGLGLPVTGKEYPVLMMFSRNSCGQHEGRLSIVENQPGTMSSGGSGSVPTIRTSVIAIHPGSGGRMKNWPLDRFIKVGHAIGEDGVGEALFICGECEAEMIPRLEREFGRNRVVSSLDLVELAGLLAGCAAYVGNDSGITHLAAAVGIRTVALFGPSDPAIWGPRGPHVRIIAAKSPTSAGLVAIPVSAVLSALLPVVKSS